ncbi:hypothetical protein ABNM77_004175 [Salmonella enterica subsp. enterica serovar Braenderup]|nr:hypothetical protein [Salmonella enterica subsp. enterica serovar Braenderup]EJE3232943.1 hypothetical protein [Salmonella enterica]EJM1946389.1 hypothetical protein [Salmonella enterica subsp. enterica serovar Braenderup]EJT8627759.1 hypothetical protein [Salmonella enterica subsp. enterica serovar Braenderup]EJV0216261.1 hypothetical protein [Salmonella enterica subsp. enterica serovar Braenderup]
MACNCFKNIKERMDARLREAVASNCSEVDESDFDNRVFILEKGDFCNVMLPYRFRYYRRKKNGQPEQRCTNADTRIAINYCLFCGTKFNGKELPTKESTA